MNYFYDCELVDDGRAIGLISIGVVCEDGREFYAQNSEADLAAAGEWVRANVLPRLTADAWMSRNDLRARLLDFCDPERYGGPEFWGYVSAYDHVALYQLFGPLVDRPPGWPKFTRDLRQWRDRLGDPELPGKEGAHHALEDARWNRRVYHFLEAYGRELLNGILGAVDASTHARAAHGPTDFAST